MRKVILSMMVSLDGYIESRNPEAYWHNLKESMSCKCGNVLLMYEPL